MKLGIISDIHEDIVSLHKALDMLEKKGCDEIICLGDTVGVCVHYDKYNDTRDAKKCIGLVRRNCKYVIAGNHDLFAALKIPEYRGGFDFPGNWYDMDIMKRTILSNDKVWLYEDELESNLDEEEKQYISLLPEYLIIENKGMRILFSHFLFPDITGSTTNFPDSKNKLAAHYDFLKKMECTKAVCGHIHAEGIMKGREQRMNIFNPFLIPFKTFPFGEYEIKNALECIAIPAVAYTNRKNGVAFFYMENMIITAIPLK